jgi:hypothetical protein
VRPFLLRPHLRHTLGQTQPRFDIGQIFTERKVLLVTTAKGTLGPEASALFGSLVVSQLWHRIIERATVAPERRHSVFVYIDEFQDVLHLPGDVSDALTQARGMGVGLTLAHQHLRQLPPDLRAAVLANARSRVCFQLEADDARAMATPSVELEADDFQNLPAFEVYARVMAQGSVQPWCSLATEALSPAIREEDEVRDRSRRQFGVPPAEVETQLRRLTGRDGRKTATDDLAPRRRGNAS